jgi:ParB family chromosome partitioning protein
MSRGPALGRGLNALIPRSRGDDERDPQAGVATIPVSAVEANPAQPRQFIEPAALEELAASIREHGVLQPVLVHAGDAGGYVLIAGERRWRAAQLAGLTEIPAIVTDVAEKNVLTLALVENIQRQDLSPLEEAHAYQRLVEESGLTQEQIAQAVGRSRSAITNAIRLLQLPAPVRMSLAAGEISEGHARAILGAPSEEQQIRLWERVREQNYTVRQAEAAAAQLRDPDTRPAAAASAHPPGDRLAAERLQSALGTKVTVDRRRRGGRLIIHWYDDEQLEQIVAQIGRAAQPAPEPAPASIDV